MRESKIGLLLTSLVFLSCFHLPEFLAWAEAAVLAIATKARVVWLVGWVAKEKRWSFWGWLTTMI